jgi:hypothetical protein
MPCFHKEDLTKWQIVLFISKNECFDNKPFFLHFLIQEITLLKVIACC